MWLRNWVRLTSRSAPTGILYAFRQQPGPTIGSRINHTRQSRPAMCEIRTLPPNRSPALPIFPFISDTVSSFIFFEFRSLRSLFQRHLTVIFRDAHCIISHCWSFNHISLPFHHYLYRQVYVSYCHNRHNRATVPA